MISDEIAQLKTKRAFTQVKKVIYYLSIFLNSVGLSVLFVMMLLTTADVILRYFFNKPILGSLELIVFMMAIVVGCALAYAGIRNANISVDVLISKLHPRAQGVINSITYLLSFVTFAVISRRCAWYGGSLFSKGATSTVLAIPLYPFIYIVSIGTGVFCLVILYQLYEHLNTTIKGIRWQNCLGLLALIIVIVGLFLVPLFHQELRGLINGSLAGILSVVLLLVLLFLGMPVGATMAFLALLGLAYVAGLNPALTSMGSSPYRTAASYDLSVVPLFVLMGAYCFQSGLSKDLFVTAYRWIGHFPGGLAIATIGACAGFAAVCGSSPATVATIGMVCLPEMKRYKYDSALAAGCIAAGGGLGILIPPSVVMVIYGILTEQSIGKLFLAGFIPGILQAFLYMVTIYFLCRHNPLLGMPGPSFSFKEKITSLKNTWGVLVLFLVVIGGIYFGILSPTEAAGVGAFGAFLFILGRRKLTWKNFKSSLLETSETTAMVFIILIGAILLGYFLALSRLPYTLAAFVANLPLNSYIIIGLIILIYFILGCFMGSMALIVLTVPIFAPIVATLGFDLIWFGIIIITIVEVGQITPPVGINVFVMHGVAKDIPMYNIYRGTVPFLVADIVFIILIVVFPKITLILPSFMK